MARDRTEGSCFNQTQDMTGSILTTRWMNGREWPCPRLLHRFGVSRPNALSAMSRPQATHNPPRSCVCFWGMLPDHATRFSASVGAATPSRHMTPIDEAWQVVRAFGNRHRKLGHARLSGRHLQDIGREPCRLSRRHFIRPSRKRHRRPRTVAFTVWKHAESSHPSTVCDRRCSPNAYHPGRLAQIVQSLL